MDGFHRIRHYGLLASGVCKTSLAKIRALLCVQPPDQADVQNTEPKAIALTLREPCPCCGGLMRIIEIFRRGQKPMFRAPPREQAAPKRHGPRQKIFTFAAFQRRFSTRLACASFWTSAANAKWSRVRDTNCRQCKPCPNSQRSYPEDHISDVIGH